MQKKINNFALILTTKLFDTENAQSTVFGSKVRDYRQKKETVKSSPQKTFLNNILEIKKRQGWNVQGRVIFFIIWSMMINDYCFINAERLQIQVWNRNRTEMIAKKNEKKRKRKK